MSNDTAMLEDASSSHRVYIGDSIGCLRVVQCDPPSALPKDYAGPSVQPSSCPTSSHIPTMLSNASPPVCSAIKSTS